MIIMKQIKSITSEIVDRYFPPLEDGVKAGYIRAVDILSRFIPDTVEEENRIILKEISEELYEEIRQVSLGSYCFDVSGIRKSEFRPGGGDGSRTPSMGYLFTEISRICGMT